MATLSRFTCFASLPPELRYQVWTFALTAGTVWAVGSTLTVNHRPDSRAYTGPSPPLTGLACKEAWRIMEETYVQPLQGPDNRKEGIWVSLDHTVIALLGQSADAMTSLNRFSSYNISRFRHVAVEWRTWYTLVRTCTRLALSCPALQTLIVVRRVELNAQAKPLTVERAAFYADLLRCKESYFGNNLIDCEYWRDLLSLYFGDPVPTIHLVF